MDLVTRLSSLFGTEEEVKRKRHLMLLREQIATMNHTSCGHSVMCSGSLGEGVAYPRSDDDLMYVMTGQQQRVYDRYEEATHQRALYMIPSEYSPGFCILHNTQNFAVVSSKEFRENFVRSRPGTHLHGPCASIVVGQDEYDLAKCFLCPSWPTMANEWITRRRRYGWPSPDLIETIINGGSHVVPIGNPDSPLCHVEWRVSFSFAERSLIHAFNHVQFLVYNLLKLILKRVIAVQTEIGVDPNALCSYFLKTVLFYTIENSSPEIWVNDAIDECYRKCLSLLYQFIDAKNCPNYFASDNNMMKRKVNENNKLPLLLVVSDLIACGVAGSIYICPENGVVPSRLSSKQIEFKSDEHFLHGYLLKALMVDYDTFIQKRYAENACYITTSNLLSPLLSCYKHIPRNIDSSVLNLIMKQAFTIMGLQCIEISTRLRVRNNTSTYQILKIGQAMLKIGSKRDVSSGKLQIANVLLVTGKYRHCLAIIHNVLSNMAPYVISCRHNSAAFKIYMDMICNNGHSLGYRVRKARALDVEFSMERPMFAPLPIKIVLLCRNMHIAFAQNPPR